VPRSFHIFWISDFLQGGGGIKGFSFLYGLAHFLSLYHLGFFESLLTFPITRAFFSHFCWLSISAYSLRTLDGCDIEIKWKSSLYF